MIAKEYGKYILICDTCQEVIYDGDTCRECQED